LSTINPTWTDPGSNPGLRGGRPAANRLSHGTDPDDEFKRVWKESVVPSFDELSQHSHLKPRKLPGATVSRMRFQHKTSQIHSCGEWYACTKLLGVTSKETIIFNLGFAWMAINEYCVPTTCSYIHYPQPYKNSQASENTLK
jgi:hypothetical protein